MERFKVTVEFDVLAGSPQDARDKAQALADVLNKKDPGNNAWVPRLKRISDYDDVNGEGLFAPLKEQIRTNSE